MTTNEENTNRPGYLGKSIGLVATAARAAGVGLGAAMKAGEISAVDYATMLHRCSGASCTRACEAWRADDKQKDDAPSFCANKDILDRLKP